MTAIFLAIAHVIDEVERAGGAAKRGEG